jgi:RNA polymerase sigma-70 factor (ECF subfamily)
VAGSRRRDDVNDSVAEFEAHRDLLLGVAYRILGQVSDAEDVVQEAWLRWERVDRDEVREPRAFLVRVTSRLAIDRLRRRQARREEYVGEWLPEPVATDLDPVADVVRTETLELGMLVVLETLSPLERTVFVLREAFGFTHAEIAEAIGRSEVAIRQLASRAQRHVRERRPRFEPDPERRREVTERFVGATLDGDVEGLLAVLAPEVALVADSGGLVRAPLLPVAGADKVTRFLLAVAGRSAPGQRVEIAQLNGVPAVVVREASGATASALLFDIDDGRVARIYLVGNPHKLERIGSAPAIR